MNETQFNLDYGTRISTSLPTVATELNLDGNLILNDYAEAYDYELQRRNPLKYDALTIQLCKEGTTVAEELKYYFNAILKIRVESVQDTCTVWRKAKQLVIPAWIQFVISQIGKFVDYDYGIYIIPTFDFKYDVDKLLKIAMWLESFKQDGVSMFKDAFPRDKNGDREVMSMAIVGDYVQSMSKDSHPIASYVNAFVGAKLTDATMASYLYRVRYDDTTFIKSMILSDSSLF